MKEFYNYKKGGQFRFLPPFEIKSNKYYFYSEGSAEFITLHGKCLIDESIKCLKIFTRRSNRKDKIKKLHESNNFI